MRGNSRLSKRDYDRFIEACERPVKANQALKDYIAKGQALLPKVFVTTGPLSQHTKFELIITGPFDLKEMDALLLKLQVDRQILLDDSTHTARISENTGTTQSEPESPSTLP